MSQTVHTDVKQSSGKIAVWLVRVLVQCYISSNFQNVILDRLNQPPSQSVNQGIQFLTVPQLSFIKSMGLGVGTAVFTEPWWQLSGYSLFP